MTEDETLLWRTNVGSHMWKMNRPDSDLDVFQVYVVDTKKLLMGTIKTESYCRHFPNLNMDVAGHEVGPLIQQLLKGNMNYLWGVTSPLVLEAHGTWLEKLQDIVRSNIAKNCVHSIRGMIVGNYDKYILYGSSNTCEGEELTKKCNMMCRSAEFGINILRGNGFVYNPTSERTPEDVQKILEDLDVALAASKLPEHPKEKQFREYLFEVRMEFLEAR